LERNVRALPAPMVDPPQTNHADEARELAREMTCALTQELERYRRAGAASLDRPDPAQPMPDWLMQAIRDKPDDDVSFADLERLARIDPAQATARWQQVRDTARRNFADGHHAARAFEPLGQSAWRRACFLELRRCLRQTWPPRSDGEALLLDEMAQYEMLRRHWLSILAAHSHQPATLARQLRSDVDRDRPRPVTAAEATREAVQMVAQMQRLAHNALRTLLGLRRGQSPIFVGRVGQVNVTTGQQMNVQTPQGEDETGRE
jgi:hypothetical protein